MREEFTNKTELTGSNVEVFSTSESGVALAPGGNFKIANLLDVSSFNFLRGHIFKSGATWKVEQKDTFSGKYSIDSLVETNGPSIFNGNVVRPVGQKIDLTVINTHGTETGTIWFKINGFSS